MNSEAPLTENEKRCLALLLRRQKAERSPYVPIQFLKRIPDHKRVLKELYQKDLLYYYKEEAVGLTEGGKYYALILIQEGY